jgi:hypothetical protein
MGVDLVGGDTAGYLGDGELDGGAIFEDGQNEGGVGRDVGFGGGAVDGGGAAGGVVVVAEVFAAERG